MLRLTEGVDPKHLTPRERQARFSAKVLERRSDVLEQISAQLAERE